MTFEATSYKHLAVPGMLLEFIEGVSVEELEPESPLAIANPHIGQATVDCFDRVFLLGVLHGDIHLGNIMVRPDGFVFLVDLLWRCSVKMTSPMKTGLKPLSRNPRQCSSRSFLIKKVCTIVPLWSRLRAGLWSIGRSKSLSRTPARAGERGIANRRVIPHSTMRTVKEIVYDVRHDGVLGLKQLRRE